MNQELNFEGICCNCSFRESCLSFKNSKISGRAIMYCEEFDDLPANVAKKKKSEVKLQNDTFDTGDNTVISPSAKGLCVNCDDAGICKLAGFGDNVVFCEEHSSNFEHTRKDRNPNRNIATVPDLIVKTQHQEGKHDKLKPILL